MSTKHHILPDEFERYRGQDVLPLHRYDNTRTYANGKTVNIGKAPREAGWRTANYAKRDVIAECVKHNWNMGRRLSAADVVIDIDPRNGGVESWRRFCEDHSLDDSIFPRVDTGSDGVHMYAKKPDDVEIVSKLSGYPGVDWLTLGKQHLCAGSIHPKTLKHYRWNELYPQEAPPLPENILATLARRKAEYSDAEGTHSNEQLAVLLAGLDPDDKAFRDRDAWLAIGMAAHHATGGAGEAAWVSWCKRSAVFDNTTEAGRVWDTFDADKGGGRTIGTIYKALKDAGRSDLLPAPPAIPAADDFADDDVDPAWLEESKPKHGWIVKKGKAPDNIVNAYVAVAKSGLEPAWDELKQNVVLLAPQIPWPEAYGRVVNDHVLNLTRQYFTLQFARYRYMPSLDNLLKAILTEAYARKFNPVADYLNGLTWDGVPRLASLFAKYFNTADDAYTQGVSIAFMVGAVRRVRKPGCKFDTMPVLSSKQGWNKSSAIRALFGSQWFSDADMGSLKDKDASMKLRGIWVQEFAELEALRAADVATLKAFCSRQEDRQRDPYGRTVDDVPRRCVFIGTTNEGGYLKDSTGGRRFWPLDVLSPIDVEAIKADRDQLWSEAAHLEAQGVSDVLPRNLWEMAGERQAEQTAEDPWTDTLRQMLERRRDDYDNWVMFGKAERPDESEALPPPDRIHTQALLWHLGIDTEKATHSHGQRIRRIMESLGWRHKRNLRIGVRNASGYVKPDGWSVL